MQQCLLGLRGRQEANQFIAPVNSIGLAQKSSHEHFFQVFMCLKHITPGTDCSAVARIYSALGPTISRVLNMLIVLGALTLTCSSTTILSSVCLQVT